MTKVLTRQRLQHDGVVCTCGQIKEEIEILACEYCGDGCCEDCLTDCQGCGKLLCMSCRSKEHRELCAWCEFDLENKMQKESRKKMQDVVYILVDGFEYKINNANGNASLLIDATDAIKGKLKLIDIKGLGVLKYKYRNMVKRKPVMRKGKKVQPKGFAYYLTFEIMFEI